MLNSTFLRRLSIAALFSAVAAHGQVPPATTDSNIPASTSASTSAETNSGSDIKDTEWKFVTRLSAIATYDDNVFIQPQNEKEDFYFHFAPSLAVGIGTFRSEIAPFAPIPHILATTGEEELPRKDFAYGSYTPDAVIFSKYHHENTINHDVRLAARKERDQWTTQGQFHFQYLNDINIDVGQRLRQTYYTANGSAMYALSGKTNATVEFQGTRADYSSGFASSTDVRGLGGFEYQIAPKTALGLGAAIGYLDVEKGGNQTYQQPLAQLRYNPTGKLSFLARAGEEFRQFTSNVPDRSQFVFSLAGNYEPSEDTNLTLTSRRDTTSSAQYAGENIAADTYEANLRQRLFTRMYLGVAGGYVRNRYETNRVVTPISRRDEYYFGKISASRDITTFGTIELSYEHRENDSTLSNFGFTQNVASLAASFMF